MQLVTRVKSIFLVSFIFFIQAAEAGPNEREYEYQYQNLANNLYWSNADSLDLTIDHRSKILIDVLWDNLEESSWNDLFHYKSTLNQIDSKSLDPADQFRLYYLKEKFNLLTPYDSFLIENFYQQLMKGELSERAVTLFLYHKVSVFQGINFQELESVYPQIFNTYRAAKSGFVSKTKEEVQDLFYRAPIDESYKDGAYVDVPKLFMFCRHDRRYHCLMAMKDSKGREVTRYDGKLWTSSALGLARRSVPYYQRNGYTPSGVYTLDSVMPRADQQKTFGEFRRLIMNFIPRSRDEDLLKGFLPQRSYSSNWWQESVVARDIGRNLLRIHGTGKHNYNPFAKHYPHVKTSGCVSMREGRYGSNIFRDQRVLLDEMMRAMQLAPIYQNETRLKAVFYLIELDNKEEHVSYKDLEYYLDL